MASPHIEPLNRGNRRTTQIFNVGGMRMNNQSVIDEEEEEPME